MIVWVIGNSDCLAMREWFFKTWFSHLSIKSELFYFLKLYRRYPYKYFWVCLDTKKKIDLKS